MPDDDYRVELSDTSKRELKSLDKTAASRIIKRLEWLSENAVLIDHYALSGEWSGFYRIRTGDYRIIYQIDHEQRVIRVLRVGHRRDVYMD